MRAYESRTLRVVVGAIFVLSGVLKAATSGSAEMAQTVVGQMMGGSVVGLVALSAVEILFGMLIAVGVWEAVLPLFGVVAALGFSVWSLLRDSPQACGCFGTLDQSFIDEPTWVITRNVIIGLGLLVVWIEARKDDPHRSVDSA